MDVMSKLPDRSPHDHTHLRYLDGLRGVAILGVVMIHAGARIPAKWPPLEFFTSYGVRGVQLFFIVSGLTLTLNYAGKPVHWPNFAVRRFLRIAPMFYLGAMLYFFLGRVVDGTYPDHSVLDVVSTVLLLHGWVPTAINSTVPGGWSIGAEAMFYLVFPAILLVAKRPIILWVVTFASFIVAAATHVALRKLFGGYPWGLDLAYYFWVVHLPAFLCGCCLATLPAHRAPPRWLGQAVLFASMLAIVIDSQLSDYSNVLIAIILLTAFTWSAGVVRPRILRAKILPFIGRVSFSIYIVHVAVLEFLYLFKADLVATFGPNGGYIAVYLLALAIGTGLAAVTYRFVELPFIGLGRRIGSAMTRAPLAATR